MASFEIEKYELVTTCTNKRNREPHNSCESMLLLLVITVSNSITMGSHLISVTTSGNIMREVYNYLVTHVASMHVLHM